jgi:hypothetical protein
LFPFSATVPSVNKTNDDIVWSSVNPLAQRRGSAATASNEHEYGLSHHAASTLTVTVASPSKADMKKKPLRSWMEFTLKG